MLTGKILVTGGTGTLGNAIVRTAKQGNWDAEFTVYSRSELRQAQMKARHPDVRMVLGDVRDYDRLAAAIAGHDLVIHAAAMKRIPECETHPTECFATNIFGSQNVVRACIAQGVKRCVGISTDKACRSVTCYGASKLAMEKLFQAQRETPTIFTLVRYGNVVASNGSVIPFWREQAANGRPLMITDRRCTRFWMAPSDAVRLIEWAFGAAAGLIAVPKMSSLGLVEMAEVIAPNAAILDVGLRSCEKIHEDLVHEDEPALEVKTAYLIGPMTDVHHTIGHSYTSDTAPRLTREQFLAMLAEAESYD